MAGIKFALMVLPTPVDSTDAAVVCISGIVIARLGDRDRSAAT